MYKKYSVNEDFFKTINEDSSYVLGWIASDGCIQYIPDKKYAIRIEIQDKEMLELIKTLMNSNHEIRETNYKNSQLYLLVIDSKKLVKQLLDLGITPNKAKRNQLPPIDNKCLKHFIRGYFDGDGSVYKYKMSGRNTERLVSYICSSSKQILEQIGEFLKEEINLIPKIHQENPQGYDPLYKLVYGAKESYALYRWMYEDTNNYLQRKKEIFDNSIENKIGLSVKKCVMCGKELVAVNGRTRYCSDCKKIVLKERDRVKREKRKLVEALCN